jgi:hypothetical protein
MGDPAPAYLWTGAVESRVERYEAHEATIVDEQGPAVLGKRGCTAVAHPRRRPRHGRHQAVLICDRYRRRT